MINLQKQQSLKQMMLNKLIMDIEYIRAKKSKFIQNYSLYGLKEDIQEYSSAKIKWENIALLM